MPVRKATDAAICSTAQAADLPSWYSGSAFEDCVVGHLGEHLAVDILDPDQAGDLFQHWRTSGPVLYISLSRVKLSG